MQRINEINITSDRVINFPSQEQLKKVSNEELTKLISFYTELLLEKPYSLDRLWSVKIEIQYHRGITYLFLKKYGNAISDLTFVIKKHPSFFSYAHFYRGCAYEADNIYDNAIADYVAQIMKCIKGEESIPSLSSADFNTCGAKDKSHPLLINFNLVLKKITFEHITNIPKRDLYTAITQLSHDEQFHWLNQCLDRSTPLGKRFFKQEGVRECSIERGVLKEIATLRDSMKVLSSNSVIGEEGSDNDKKFFKMLKQILLNTSYWEEKGNADIAIFNALLNSKEEDAVKLSGLQQAAKKQHNASVASSDPEAVELRMAIMTQNYTDLKKIGKKINEYRKNLSRVEDSLPPSKLQQREPLLSLPVGTLYLPSHSASPEVENKKAESKPALPPRRDKR